MKDFGVFDIIGPKMTGPSSSHTAGAARLGLVAYRLAHGRPESAHVTLYGSFARTGRGHGTDKAIIGGILGMEPDNPGLRDSLDIVAREGLGYTVEFSEEEMPHPNTARMQIGLHDGMEYDILGVSIGGGNIEIRNINDMEVSFSAAYPTLLVFYRDMPGMVSAVSGIISDAGINIAFMKVFRKFRRQDACMVIETDEGLSGELAVKIKETCKGVTGVCIL